MTHRAPPPKPSRGITIFLVVVLGLQFVAGFKLVSPPRKFEFLAPLRIAESPTLWPFLDYNMYDASHREGETIGRPLLFAMLPDGTRIPVDETDFALPFRRFRDEILWPLRDLPNAEADALSQRLADEWAAAGRVRPRSFRVEIQTLTIGRDGFEEVSLDLHRVILTRRAR